MRIICLVCVAALLWTSSAHATVLVPADLGELVRGARAIARGRVVAVEAQWTADHRTIETIVSLEVDAYLKGSFGSIVRFRVPGGVMGRYRNIIAGAPQFELNQHVVVFLGTFGPRVPHLIGFNQGVFRVAAPEGTAGWTVRGERSRSPVLLADFERRVRDLAGGR
jgi:hypothetical protein